MVHKNLNKFLIFIILSLLANIVIYGQQFRPAPRIGHTATYLRSKIYYIGGGSLANKDDISTSDFFYLSIEKNFSWVDLRSQGVKLPLTSWHTSDIGGSNQDLIFIIGGFQIETTISVYTFDTKTNAINTPVFQGKAPQSRLNVRSVSNAGNIYIFGGRQVDSINGKNIWFNNLDILDTINMNWKVGSIVNAPPPRFSYTATLVNGVIYYIGGMQQDGTGQIYVPMSNISRYDITGDTWTSMTATAAVDALPGERIGHSAILVESKICIYGGTAGARQMPSAQPIAMLDTTTLAWSIPKLQNPNVPSLTYHTATLIGVGMLIAFGNLTNISGGSTFNDKFYIFFLNRPIVNWDSVSDLVPLQPPPSSSSSPPPPPSSSSRPPTASPTDLSTSPTNPVVIGLSAGLGAVVLIAGIVAFLFYRYKKKNKKNENISGHLGIPGASDSQIPSGGDIHYQKYSSQFTPYSNSQNPYYSQTSTLTHSQALPSPQERFSQHPSNYSPGNGAPLHF